MGHQCSKLPDRKLMSHVHSRFHPTRVPRSGPQGGRQGVGHRGPEARSRKTVTQLPAIRDLTFAGQKYTQPECGSAFFFKLQALSYSTLKGCLELRRRNRMGCPNPVGSPRLWGSSSKPLLRTFRLCGSGRPTPCLRRTPLRDPWLALGLFPPPAIDHNDRGTGYEV